MGISAERRAGRETDKPVVFHTIHIPGLHCTRADAYMAVTDFEAAGSIIPGLKRAVPVNGKRAEKGALYNCQTILPWLNVQIEVVEANYPNNNSARLLPANFKFPFISELPFVPEIRNLKGTGKWITGENENPNTTFLDFQLTDVHYDIAGVPFFFKGLIPVAEMIIDQKIKNALNDMAKNLKANINARANSRHPSVPHPGSNGKV